MPRSLYVRLLGAFVLVILVFAVVITVLANRATASQFRVYTDESGQLWTQRLAPALAIYYVQTGSWQGVETALSYGMGMGMTRGSQMGNVAGDEVNGGGRRGGMGMMGSSQQEQSPTATPTVQAIATPDQGSMWDVSGQRLLLADAGGTVVFDSQAELVGAALPVAQLGEGQPVLVDGQPVGTIMVAASATSPDSLSGEYLSSVSRSISLAALAAGGVALTLGSLISFQITAPIRKLRTAARAIAAGDLTQRVTVGTRDEVGELSLTFNDMAESLARSEGERRQMVADVAHELRTPLSVMQANLEAMQDGVLPLDAEQIASLHEETDHLTRLVSDLRLLSVAEAGQLKLELSGVDPADLVRKSAARLRSEADEKGIQLQVQVPRTPLPRVLADADRVSQVIGNLVGNALRYTPAGGSITIAASASSQDQRRPPMVLISVTDNGAGIPSLDLPHIFDRFYRADRSRTRGGAGSGLGLAIVRHLVEAHGGSVWAESPIYQASGDQGPGTRLSFTLPVLDPSFARDVRGLNRDS